MVRGTNLGVQLGRSRGNDGRLGVMLGRKQLLYAITSFSVANYYATQNPGGEAGVATGFLSLVVARADKILGAVQVLTQRNGAAAGHQIYVDSGGGINAQVYDGAANKVASSTLTASDVGKLHAFLLYHDSARLWLWVDRQQIGSGTAVAGYTPSPTAQRIGLDPNAVFPAITFPIAAALSARGTPSDVQIRALFDDVRVRGDVPTSFAGATVTHRWSARDALAGGSVVDGQTAPASLPDTVTGAAADAMTRTGSPTVRVLDTSIDGRRTYGAMGFSATNYLESAPGGGIRGAAAGFWGVLHLRIDQQTGITSSYRLAATCGASWDVRTQLLHNSIYFSTDGATPGNAGASGVYTIAAGDVGTSLFVLFRYDGVSRVPSLFARGALVGAGIAKVGAYSPPAGSASMILGKRSDGFAADGLSMFGFAGGDGYTLTDAEALACLTACEAAGRIVPIAGKTDNHYDLTADTIAAGGPSAGIPAQVQDRVGTDHLTRVGGLVVSSGGVKDFSTGAWIASALNGGLFGSASGLTLGWHGVVPVGANGMVISRYLTSGYYLQVTTGAVRFVVFDAVGAFTATASYAVPTNTPITIAGVYTGAGGVIRLLINGAQQGTDLASVTMGTPTTPMLLGYYTAQPFGGTILGMLGANRGDLSNAEIAAWSSATLAAGKVQEVAGKSDRRYSLVDDIAEAGGKIPAVWRERVAGVDHMITVGSGLQVAQRVERIYSWEAA